MQFDIITIFPDFFSSILAHGVLKRALASNLLSVQTHNLRDFAHDRHRTVDDRPDAPLPSGACCSREKS